MCLQFVCSSCKPFNKFATYRQNENICGVCGKELEVQEVSDPDGAPYSNGNNGGGK